jgi:signal transduction histidine kinase
VAPRTIALASAAVSAALFVGVAAAVAGPWWTGLARWRWPPSRWARPPATRSAAAASSSSRSRTGRAGPEEALEQEAGRRVADERLHIARDVHDLVAHHIAVVNVQAGVAAHVLADRPDAAREALGHVTEASRAALDELGSLIGVLRGSDESAPSTPTTTAPTPGLADLERLVAAAEVTGLRVDREVVGAPRELPPAVDVSAYRIVQEALTNAGRHGAGRARLILTYAPQQLEIEIRNRIALARAAGPATGSSACGNGLPRSGAR